MYYTLLEELDDMLPESFIVANSLSKGESTGLFLEDACFCDVESDIYFISKTAYKKATSMMLSSSNESPFSLFDAFHGYCFYYLKKFIENELDNGIIWESGFLMRDDTFTPLVHAFAYRFLEDGRCLYADARGITDNVSVFFSANMGDSEDYFQEFLFSKRDCYFLLKESSFKTKKYNELLFDCFEKTPSAYNVKKVYNYLETIYCLYNEKRIAM